VRIIQHPQHRILGRFLARPRLRRRNRPCTQPGGVRNARGDARLRQRGGVLVVELRVGHLVQQLGLELLAEARFFDGAAAGAASGEEGIFGRLLEAACHGPLFVVRVRLGPESPA
jgi:hypothetical protein